MAISCQAFGDFLARKSEHLDEEILLDITPASTVIGHVETGRFPALDGTSHTFDRFNRVFPDMSREWSDVQAGSCIGAPCDPTEDKIGLGFTRDMYKLQRKSWASDLLCWDLILSADRAKQQFANYIKILRDATNLIISDRLRTEMFRIAGYHWVASLTAGRLTPFTFTESGNLISVQTNVLPTSKMVVNMLRQRLETQILNGALGEVVVGMPPELEVLADYTTIWDLVQGDTSVTDHWRFESFKVGSKEYNEYGWKAQVGNFMLHADLHPLRFQITADNKLNRVFPYTNVAATQGIRGIVNDAYINAPVEAIFIWHRRGMINLVRDAAAINPMMPFAARDFGGKWQFAMDNLTCGTVMVNSTEVPIAVDNSRRNKGIFKADFEFATKPQYPEFVEVFLVLREPACIVEVPPCATTPAYVSQSYSSANTPCED